MVFEEIDAALASVLLRAVSNPARLRIILHLLNGERSVAELESDLGLRQPNLSQHLAELRNVNLVATRREVKSIFYRLADDSARRLAGGLLQGFGGGPPAAMASAAPVATIRKRPQQAAVFAKIHRKA